MLRFNNWIKELVWLSQLGFSLLTPPVICLLLAYIAIEKWSFPAWIMLPAFIFGFGGAFGSFLSFYKYTQRKADKSSKKEPPAFNDHK